MDGKLVSDYVAESVDYVDNASRHTGGMDAFQENLRLYRAKFAGFDNDCSSSCDRRRKLSGDVHVVRIPRSN